MDLWRSAHAIGRAILGARSRGVAVSSASPAEPVGLAEVAREIIPLEDCPSTPGVQPASIGRAGDFWAFPAYRARPLRACAYRLRNVVLDRASMIVLQDGRPIRETIYVQPPEVVAQLRVRPADLRALPAGQAVATVFDHWDSNYYHWMVHGLPAAHVARQLHPRGDVTLLTPHLSGWQRRTLELLGVAGLPLHPTEYGAQYFIPDLLWSDYLAGRADFSDSALSRQVYASMAQSVPPRPDRPRLYIDRRNKANRQVPNEAELIERLAQRGFLILRPEEHSIDAQIALFRAAGMVVGLLGAGLANIAFCRPGAVVYELVPSHHCNPCFFALAIQQRLQYWGDKLPTGVQGSDHLSPWTVPLDVAHVLRRVAELEPLIPV